MLNPIGLIRESTNATNISVVPNINSMKEKEHSFFIETLNFLTEANRDFYEANRLYYKTLTEGIDTCNVAVVQESYGDFFDKVKAIIDKFLAFIKSLFDKFVTMLNKLIGRDKYILNNKDKLKDFSKIYEFDMTGFTYTIYDNIPTVEVKAHFEDGFVFDLNPGNNGATIKFSGAQRDVAANIRSASNTLSNNLEDGSYYDKIRGEVIGEDNLISKDDYASVLYSVFRNDESIAEQLTVDNSEVTLALKRFETAKSDIEKAKRTKAKIDSEYNSVRKSVENMVKTNRSGGVVTAKFDDRLNTDYTLTNDDIISMDNFIKIKTAQIQEMANIHALAFAAKLDAMTDCYKQDKTLLFKALSRVQGTKKEEV